MFRRGFAVEFLRAGGDPFRLQLIMGHEKLDMTRIYSQALSQKTR
jgi:site-specific recombinase XerD